MNNDHQQERETEYLSNRIRQICSEENQEKILNKFESFGIRYIHQALYMDKDILKNVFLMQPVESNKFLAIINSHKQQLKQSLPIVNQLPTYRIQTQYRPPGDNDKVIFLIGQISSGKTTLVQFLYNYLTNAFESDIRYYLEEISNQCISLYIINCPTYPTLYIYELKSDLDSNLDGPILMKQMLQIAQNIKYISLICLFFKASDVRVDKVQQNLMISLFNNLPKSYEANVVSLITFSDGLEPQIIDILYKHTPIWSESLRLADPWSFIFNCSTVWINKNNQLTSEQFNVTKLHTQMLLLKIQQIKPVEASDLKNLYILQSQIDKEIDDISELIHSETESSLLTDALLKRIFSIDCLIQSMKNHILNVYYQPLTYLKKAKQQLIQDKEHHKKLCNIESTYNRFYEQITHKQKQARIEYRVFSQTSKEEIIRQEKYLNSLLHDLDLKINLKLYTCHEKLQTDYDIMIWNSNDIQSIAFNINDDSIFRLIPTQLDEGCNVLNYDEQPSIVKKNQEKIYNKLKQVSLKNYQFQSQADAIAKQIYLQPNNQLQKLNVQYWIPLIKQGWYSSISFDVDKIKFVKELFQEQSIDVKVNYFDNDDCLLINNQADLILLDNPSNAKFKCYCQANILVVSDIKQSTSVDNFNNCIYYSNENQIQSDRKSDNVDLIQKKIDIVQKQIMANKDIQNGELIILFLGFAPLQAIQQKLGQLYNILYSQTQSTPFIKYFSRYDIHSLHDFYRHNEQFPNIKTLIYLPLYSPKTDQEIIFKLKYLKSIWCISQPNLISTFKKHYGLTKFVEMTEQNFINPKVPTEFFKYLLTP